MKPTLRIPFHGNKTGFVFVVFLLCMISSSVFAQDGDDQREKIESLKIGFLTQKLDLTPEEAQTFWPVYNQYRDKLKEVRKSHRSALKNSKQNIDTLSDKELESLVDGVIVLKQKELDIKKEYHSKFKSLLPMKKVAKLYAAEEQFKVHLIKQLQEKRD